MDFRDFSEPAVEIAGLRTGHDALIATISASAPHPTAPSLLPGWTIGHVLVHVAHNADGYRSVHAGRPQYESYDARDRAIDAEAGRPLDEIVATMAVAHTALVDAFEAEHDFGRPVQMLVRPSQPGLMILGRRREIEVHHLDLDLGRQPADIDTDYVERDVTMLAAWWEAKNRAPLPHDVAAGPPLDRWMWLVGRAPRDGLAPAALF